MTQPTTPIWFRPYRLDDVSERSGQTLVSHLGIEFTELGCDYLRGRMPVDARTHQPYGILHGGASVVLAETLGSSAANLVVDPALYACVGLEINANHVRAVREGFVTGTARPLHLGRSNQIWEIRIENDAGQLTCISRLTMSVLEIARLGGLGRLGGA